MEQSNNAGEDGICRTSAMPELLSNHLLGLIEKTGGRNGPIGLQFVARPRLENRRAKTGCLDPLNEEDNEVAPGLVYKYRGDSSKSFHYGRALWLISDFCRSYCRFCTRGRRVGLSDGMSKVEVDRVGREILLTDEQIKKTLKYIASHPEIKEIIVSGGDPLFSPKKYLTKIITGLAELQKKGNISIVRIGTRLPVHDPYLIRDWHYSLLAKLRNPYLMVHINHPSELTDKTIEVLRTFREKCLATVMSQSVLLKGVNDKEEVLLELFFKLASEGIRPYYLYQNDPVAWAQHFTYPLGKGIKLWSKIRTKLSGVAATARFVIDVPFGAGKVPVPEGDAWEVDYRKGLRDFSGKRVMLNMEG